jgi:hypothetical protein
LKSKDNANKTHLITVGFHSLFNTPNTEDTAELYNPSTGVWQATGALNVSRASGAALLENGRVLVVDGYNTVSNTTTYLASAELYDPSIARWSFTASMQEPTAVPTTPVLLTNGDVLIADEAQFYNPGTASWISTGPLPETAGPPSVATLLNTGMRWPAGRGVPIVAAEARPVTDASCTLSPATHGP